MWFVVVFLCTTICTQSRLACYPPLHPVQPQWRASIWLTNPYPLHATRINSQWVLTEIESDTKHSNAPETCLGWSKAVFKPYPDCLVNSNRFGPMEQCTTAVAPRSQYRRWVWVLSRIRLHDLKICFHFEPIPPQNMLPSRPRQPGTT